MTRRYVIERWVQRKTDQKLIFNGNYTQIVFFVFRIHFHYVLSYLFDLFGVRTCVSILWHTSLPKNTTFAWKNNEKTWFWRFLVIFVFLTWRHLWCHCDVIQCIFVLFWYQWTREGHSYPLVPHTWCFVNRFPRSWGGGIRPRPDCEMGPKSPALLGLKGGIGSLFDPCVNAMGRQPCCLSRMEVSIVLSDLARSFCAHYRYRVIRRTITNMRAWLEFTRERQLTLTEIIWRA